MAKEVIPDIIITDLMMPRLDGFGMLEELKNHHLTSHIPIIVLTAKSDSKTESLRKAADAYLKKPFDREQLQLTVNNFMEFKRRIRASFSSEDRGLTKNEGQKDSFLDKVNKVILDNLENTTYNVEDLSHAMHVSRSQMYRKLKAVTDMSIVEYMRYYRLNAAKQKLRETDSQISTISLEVGISDPSYFSKVFKAHYGMTPQEFRDSQR